jgi:hypothetical protein
VIANRENQVLKLKKALYGLHQAPRAWNQKLDASLEALGFLRCPSEPAIYCRGNKGGVRLVVGVYVDDLIITGNSKSEIMKFKSEMTKMFKMSDLGLLHYYLGIEVKQQGNGFMLSQESYVKKILEKAGLDDCNPCKIPMEPKTKLSKVNTSPLVDATFYRSLVGSLRYLVNTRPDIAFAVGFVSRFMQEPHADHLVVVKHILRYLAGSSSLGLFYPKGGAEEPVLVGHSDSDLAGDIDERKSTTGLIFFLGKSPVGWQSAKQRIVAVSSCEAEYVAAATASCQLVWMGRLLSEITGKVITTPRLKIDNKSAISLVKNPVLNDRSKHIDTRFHLIREHEANGQIVVEFIRTEEQLADILTKALHRVKFQELNAKIGLFNLSS